MLRKWAIAVCVSLIPVLGVAQDNPRNPTGDQAQRGLSRRGDNGRFQGVVGTITAIGKNQLSLRTMEGNAVTVKLSAETHYRKDRQSASLADFKVGDMVMVGGEPAGENTWTARFLASRSGSEQQIREGLGKRFIAGEIKSIDGTSLTILRIDGETQTIQVDESTSFRKQGESITLGDFKPGDHVFGRGELKNGTFVAAVLNAGDFQQMGPPRPRGSPDRQ